MADRGRSHAEFAYTSPQASSDSFFPRGRRYYWKAQFLKQIADRAIDALTDGYARAASPFSLAVLQQVGGAIFSNRDAAYDCFPVAIWENAVEDEQHIA